MIVGPRLIPRHIGVILVVVIGAAVRVIGEGPPHQAVANAVAAAERVLWLHIPKTGGTTLALVAMKAALKKEGKIAVCAYVLTIQNPHACLTSSSLLISFFMHILA